MHIEIRDTLYPTIRENDLIAAMIKQGKSMAEILATVKVSTARFCLIRRQVLNTLHPRELKIKIAEMLKEGKSVKEISDKLEISKAHIHRVKKMITTQSSEIITN